MDFDSDQSLKEWAKDKPLSILQLDPADRAVLKIADERDAIQKKTFTKWVNKHLKKANRHVNDLFLDLQDGHNLISLLEVLSGEHLPRERGKMRFHMLQNVQMALDFLRYKKIKLVNIRAEDIVDGNPKLTLGLIWTIILHFQISDIVVGQEPNVSAKEVLLRWARRSTAKYPGVKVSDFTQSWRDGLAFNALIHRNRPDLIDWRNIRSRQVRDRLENAFHVAEREYGVTRLLDPEDVDTHEIDEKSIITYISSLYDVFPEPPAMHPLYDSESQSRVSDFRDLASSLTLWMREKTALMSDRNFPQTLIEIKKLVAESNRFRTEEIPARQRDKTRLQNTFRDLQRYFESVGEVDVEPELQIDNIERNWNRMMMAHSERDHALQDELKRLERLQKLAEKVHREMKRVDTRLEDLESRVNEEARRLDRLHPLDAKRNVDVLEEELRATEENIQTLFNDVTTLREGHYPQASDLHKRVQKLHQRWVSLRSLLHSKLIQPLASLSFPVVEERTVTRQTRTVLETRLVDTNVHFRQLHDCLDWCRSKMKQLQEAEFGSDLPGVEAELDLHRREHKSIEQFHTRVEHCINAKNNFHGDELSLYVQHLNVLQKNYAELLSVSSRRLTDLETLHDFLQSATNQLVWLNEREETEVTRDWSSRDINIPALEQYYESLMSELEKREIGLSSVQDRGEALLLQQHPAAKCIEAFIAAIQAQWAWLLQLVLCLETHLKHAAYHQHFFKDVREIEAWLNRKDELLNTTYSQSEFTLDEGEALLRGLGEVRDELNAQGELVSSLEKRAQNVVPLKQRRQPVARPMPVLAVCSYNQGAVRIEKGEQWILHDNSGRVKWRVSNGSTGSDCNVPGVVFLIPPPDREALDALERLRRQFERSLALWQRKQLRMRQNMIFATIRVVRGWDLTQFLAMGADQRNAIRKALNEDASKLLSEGDSSDPQLRRLRREMDDVNRLFDEFERRARAEEESKNAGRIFSDQATALTASLDEAERTLNTRLASPVPRDLDTLEHLVVQHKDFEQTLKSLAPDLETVQATFKSITRKTPAQQQRLDKLLAQWNHVWNCSHLYVERLKCVEMLLSSLDETNTVLSDFELKLASFGEMPSNLESLQRVHEELIRLQKDVSRQQPVVDQLIEDGANARRVVDKSRAHLPPRGAPHPDVERLDTDLHRLTQRWNNICSQLMDRLRSCENAYSNLTKLANSYQTEVTFLDTSYNQLNSLAPIKSQAKEQIEPTKALFNSVIERTSVIETVNIDGGRFIREAKIYNRSLQRYREWLVEDVHPSLDASSPGSAPGTNAGSGGEADVARDLDILNHRFQALVSILQDRMKKLAEMNPHDSEFQEFASNIGTKPLRTFRTEFNIYESSGNNGADHLGVKHSSQTRISTSDLTDPGGTLEGNVTKSVASVRVTRGSSKEKIIKSVDSESTSPMGGNTSKTNGETNVGTTMRFSEIRSLRRVQRVEEGIGTDAMLDMPGIVHPQTGELLTVGDAVRLRILDVRTGHINTVVDAKPVALSIKEAVAKGLVDPGLADRLLGPSGITVGSEDAPDGSKEQISLLEAIQRELYDAERGPHERVKVREARRAGKTIAEAVKAGVLDVETGRYKINSGSNKDIELMEAFSLGKLITGKSLLGEGKKRRGLSLSDTIDLGLFDVNTGCIVDRNDGLKHDLQKAVELGLLDSNVHEIVDVIEDEKMTLAEALQSKIIDDNMYQHRLSSESLPYKEAKRRQLIIRPMTLKDTVDLEIYDDGRIRSPTHRAKISVIDSISRGVLDSDNIKCVVKTPTQELLTLSEALSEGIIRPEGIYVDKVTGQNLSIPEAVEKGLITSVCVKSIFDIDCFKDTNSNQFLSLNKAFQMGVLNEKGQFVDTITGQIVPFEEAIKQDLIRPEALDMLNCKIGLKSRSGRELTVFDAVVKNLIDPYSGNILERRTRKVLALQDAVKHGVITVEGASLLKSLLSITLTTQTVTKTINHYSTKITVIPEPNTIEKWEDEKNLGAVKRKSSSPLKETLKKALDSLASRSPSPKKIQKDNITSLESVQVPPNTTEDKQVYELPPNGWFLSEAIEYKLFDPVTGLFIIPGTDRLVSFEECVKLEIINPKSAIVVEPNRNQNISLPRALEKRILDATGHYYLAPQEKKITMKEAIANDFVILETGMDTDRDSSRKIQITKVSGGPDLVEVGERGTDSFKQIRGSDHETTPPEPLRVSKDIIFDSSTALVINTDSNQAKDIFEAIKDKEIELDKVLVKDPNSGKNMSLPEAIKKGIINENTGHYKDAAGRSIGFADAAKFGVIAVIGAPLVAAGKAIEVLKDVVKDDQSKTGDEATRRRNSEDITEEINNKIQSKTSVAKKFENTPLSGSAVYNNSIQRPMSPTFDDVFNETPVLSPGELTRGRVTTEPKYKVSIGRARSLSQSPDREGKPVILQKMRRKVVKPCEAVQEGLIDEATANILENFVAPDGESIKEAVETKIIDGNTGAIRDPQRGDLLTIKEALNRGLLDSSGSSGSNRLLIPVARSLSVPAVLEQGLYENGKIVHPETGAHLSLKEAITCDIVDPLSRIIEPGSGNELTLQEAIDKGAVDDLTSRVKTRRGSLDLLAAVKTGDFFEELEASSKLPPAGMTFSVALKRGLIDPKSKEVIHPITGYRKPIEVAIDDNFIMTLPGPISPDSISVSDALSLNLIDSANGVFIHPKTKDKIPISEAVETGLLILKPQDDVKNMTIVTETVTKNTVEIDTGYEIDGKDIINLKTGEKLSVDEAVKRGIVKNSFAIPKNSSNNDMEICDGTSSPVKGTEERFLKSSSSSEWKAMSKGDSFLKDSVEQFYDPETKKFRDCNKPENLMTLEEAMNQKIIDPVSCETLDDESINETNVVGANSQRSGKTKHPKIPSDISVKDAAKLGLLAVVGAPVLAGKAVFDAVKGIGKGKSSDRVEIVPTELHLNLPVLSADLSKNAEDELVKNKEKADRGSRKEFVEPESTMVKIGGKVLTFEHAFEDGIIDLKAGLIKCNNVKINFEEALERGIMIKVKRPISIIDAVEKGIYDEESGLFMDPASGELLSLQEAIETNLIDPESVKVKDIKNPSSSRTLTLKEAIEKGVIDGDSGKVFNFNSTNVPELSLREAMDKGILVMKRPPMDKEVEKVIVPKDLKECTLGEAITFKLIDPGVAVVKNPRTGGFKLLKEGIKDGLIDVDRNVVFESQSTKIEPLMVNYDNGTFTIFLKEPLKFGKAVTDKHLDLKTGKIELPTSKEIINLDEAIIAGYIDPESVLIKDTAKTKLLKVPEAIRKGVMDSVKFNVVDTATSKLSSFSAALDNGLITTQDLSLIDSLDFGLYNPTSGTFTDPFCSAGGVVGRRRLTLCEAIQEHLVDASTTVIKDPSTGDICSLNNAISNGLLDADIGRMNETKTGKLLDLIRAKQRGYILPAETRQAMEEKYKLCEEVLSQLLAWIAEIEDRLAHQEVAQENTEHLRNQINILKLLKEELDSQQRSVANCLDQVRVIVTTGGEYLSREEVASLERNGKSLRTRYDRATDRTERLLRRLIAAGEELSKFKSEITVFSNWLEQARRSLDDREQCLASLNRTDASGEQTREFVSDVIAHQADLRFITMAAQKFVDESKEYLSCLNEFRTSLPARLPHIEPISAHDSAVRNSVVTVTSQYKDLLNRANALADKLSGVGGRQRDYRDALDKARSWMRDAEGRANKLLSEPLAADPHTLEDQLGRAKALNNEFVAQGRLIDNLKVALESLVRAVEGQVSGAEIAALREPVFDLENKYSQLCDALGERCKLLDTALVQSQGVQDALDSLLAWLSSAESRLKDALRPVSLNKDRLEDRLREYRVLQSDIDTHRPSVDSVTASAQELVATASNPRLAKKIESKLKDVTSRMSKVQERCLKLGDQLSEIQLSLTQFSTNASQLQRWLSEATETAQDTTGSGLDELVAQRDSRRDKFESTVREGKALVNRNDVTDTGAIRDQVKAIETQWKELNQLLDEKLRLCKARTEQQLAYERLRDQVHAWLVAMETRVGRLEPVAVDVETVKRQAEELKPLLKDHREYASTIDKLNDLGQALDSLTRPESPIRRRSSVSPVKRASVTARRTSQDVGSPSPTKMGSFSLQSPLSPGGSSGFGSRRSSPENFHLEEMTPVQHELNEVNNRYSLLGVRLNDRQSEIDSLKDELRKHADHLRQLSQFLDKVQRTLPKETIAQTKDEAEKTCRAARAVQEEMYEKQALLESTKAGITDLLRRKGSVAGADRLHDELQDVVSRWRALQDACKNRIALMEGLKDFYDTHDNLSSWLASKDRMITVLGPISSDSRMVQSQVQQVQVLREEFRTQQPQLQHLSDVAADVLSRVPADAPDSAKINNKLRAVQDRWNDLSARLDARLASLGAAADTTREFDAALTRLRDTLQAISDQLDDVPTDREPEEQLRKVQMLERQLEGARPLLADLESAGADLCDVLSDPASRADIQAKLSAVDRQYSALQKKLDLRKAEIENTLRDGRQFEATCAKMLGWLSEQIGALNERLLVSADRDVLQQQVDTHEPIYKEVLQKEHEVIMLLNKGHELISRAANISPQRTDTRSLQRDVDKIQQLWERLRKDASERQTRLQTCMEHCRKYYRAADAFTPWLAQAEARLDSLRPDSFKRRDVDRQLRELSAFRNEVWKRSGEFENSRSHGETFVAACDVDKEVVKQELAAIKTRWDKLNNELLEKTQWLEEMSRRLTDFADQLRDLNHSVQRCEDRLASHDAIGAAARDPKALERIKLLRDETNALRKPLAVLRKSADDLVSEAAEVGVSDASHLRDEVDSIGERLDDLQGRLDDRCSRLQSAATAVSQFNDLVKALVVDLNSLENELDTMKPPGRDLKTVRTQQDDLARLVAKISRAGDEVNRAVNAGEHLVDSGFALDTAGTRDQVESLSRQLGRLEERTRAREEELADILDKLQDFYKNHSRVVDDITQAGEDLRRLRPVGSEVDAIKSQQDEFASFRRSTVEPLSQVVDDVNRNGQGLIRSAAGGVNTSILEKDLEKMNDKWNALKEKLNERDRRLDVGLLQSGKFQEALEGFAKWLSDTEEMVANQKPPSADYKVVKAQLQEQKFLKKMLADRQNSMSSLFAMGNEVAADADAQERKAIERQLKELMSRFDKLCEGAAQRYDALMEAMAIAKDFQDKLVPVTEWLDRAEKKVKDMELVPTDEEKIQQRIREHDSLHDEILRKKTDLSELTEVGSNLMALVGEEEASATADKIQDAADRYATLVDRSDALGQLLEASRAGLRHLVLTYQDLQAWMESMEARLNRYKVLAVHTDKLLMQMEDLADLTEEVSNHQNEVDATVDSGLELMKHISSDEAIQLKDKLDSLQRRYNDLTSRCSDLLKHAQDALPLVQQFHNAHNSLVDWMLGAEAQLQVAEPSEDEIRRLEQDVQEFRPVLETINLVGPQLCQISPGEGAATIEGLVTRDNRRFDAIAEQVQRKAMRLQLSKQRSLEVIGDIDDLLDWFREVETQLREAEPPSSEPDVVRLQLKEHKALNDDISGQKGRVRDVLSTAKKVLRESTQHNDDTSTIRERTEDLRETMETVSALSSDRLGALEQAFALAEHFGETHAGLSAWLDDTERHVAMLALPALRPDLIAAQQDKHELLVHAVNEQRPLVDKLNKTGEALIKLCGEDDGAKVQDALDSDNARYAALKAEIRQRQLALEKALQESSQFSDKLEGMLRALAQTADQVSSAEPISAHPPRIRSQLDENAALVEDLGRREEAFQAVRRAANDVINKAPTADPAVKDIKRKLERLNSLWNEVQTATSDRSRSLEDALAIAERFWDELQSIMATLRDLEDSLTAQEPPAVRPQAIQRQQSALQEIKSEMDHAKPEVEACRQTGQSLMRVCGEPDKPEVRKHMEDLDSAWDNVTALFAKREENLIHAMEKAMEFHETLQELLDFLDKAEDKFSKLGPLGADIDAVKKQINQLKSFKSEVDPHMVKVEALNRQAQELTERTSAEQAAALREPLTRVNQRWDDLLRGVVERQRQLENALLRLGQFQHALAELMAWIDGTERTLDRELKVAPGDPQLLEVELAKLKVLVNDIQAHQSSVDTLNDAGRQIIEQGKGTDEASSTHEKLTTLNRRWRELLQKAADRQGELEEALRDAHRFSAELQDLLSWLGEVDGIIAASKPVGGLPETASEQLERFMEVYNELEENRPKVETVLQQGTDYLTKAQPGAASNLATNVRTLKQRWESVTARANDKKIKLEIALKEATEFHDALQAFVDWLTSAEKTLAGLKPVSRVLATILEQIEEHKAFQKEVGVHRETMLHLDKKGTHLKYFSQKQDVILIKNLLISVQHRWERVVSKSAERTRALDHGYKEAREFHDAYSNLMNWLNDTEKGLDELEKEASSIGNDPDRIKARLAKHRELQRALSGKQATYDATMRAGKSLKEKAPKSDEPALRQMMNDLKEKWNTVCAKSVDRQRKLEEALLYCGQFKDALEALADWLKKVERELSEDAPVHGDLDTVIALVDQHKALREELTSRSAQMESVRTTADELARKASPADAQTLRNQVGELNSLWTRTNRLAERRTQRLEEALKVAETLHKRVHMLLEWLSDAEMKLRFVNSLPDDDQETRNQLAEHAKFMREMMEKEVEKDATITLAQQILAKAHPDAVSVIKHWITIIQARWDEVSTWAKQREQRLDEHLRSLQDLDALLEELLAWLAGLESTLMTLEAEPLPEDIPTLEGLIRDHHEFMENTARRQGEVDSVIKARTQQPAAPTATSTPRKTSAKRLSAASKDELTDSTTDLRDTARKNSLRASRDNLLERRGSRSSPTRELRPAEGLPHYGPRFPPKGSKGSEPVFRSPRCRLLWDRWRGVWLLAWQRQRRLQERLNYLQELERVKNFSWDQWRKKFLKFMNHKKSRLTDLFRKMDKNNDGLIPRDDFVDGIIRTKFDTSRLEMSAVADMFDHNGEGFIDWKEFIAALRPDWEEKPPTTEAEKIHDEVKRLVMLCTCRQKFRVFQVGEGKYRFGDSQKLRLVRILRSTVMVRVGGGWVALDEFLVKNDPCRAKGRTNVELREQFILADGVSQSMSAFKPKASPGSQRSLSLSSGAQGPITKVRERSARSVPMGKTASGRTGTPDSLSDTEGSPLYARTPVRKGSSSARRSSATPGGSLPGSRPASRQGSKPPSRHGSNLSLASSDDGTPSRIPRRSVPASRSSGATTPTARKLTAPSINGRTRSPSTTPATKSSMHRASSIPTLTGVSSSRSRIPVFIGSPESPIGPLPHSASSSSGWMSGIPTTPSNIPRLIRTRTPSGSSTPVPSGMGATATSKLLRRPSGAADTATGTARKSTSAAGKSSATTPESKPAPFRL